MSDEELLESAMDDLRASYTNDKRRPELAAIQANRSIATSLLVIARNSIGPKEGNADPALMPPPKHSGDVPGPSINLDDIPF